MRILQICSAREIGGGERHMIDLANALARRGHEVFAAITPSSALKGELTELPCANIVELPMRNALNLSTAAKLARFARKNQINIVHAHIARDYPLAALATARGKARLVLTRHVLFPLNRINRLTLRRVRSIIAVSNAVAESLRARQMFREDQIVVIHNGIDIDRFTRKRSRSNSRENLRVGMIGHLAPIKGQEDFIHAAAIICGKRSDVDFIIAGEDKSRAGTNRRALEGLISKLGLSQRVNLLGWIKDVSELLSTLDILVSPSRSEPFGLSIVEAMAAGVPVVATQSEGAREIIDQSLTGQLVPIADVPAMAETISALLENRSRRELLAANAVQSARKRFSLEAMVEATEHVYRSAIEK